MGENTVKEGVGLVLSGGGGKGAYQIGVLKALKENLPKADIYCLINTGLKPEISNGMRQACQKYGVTAIEFDDIDKKEGHPTIKGMQDIKNTVLNVLLPKEGNIK